MLEAAVAEAAAAEAAVAGAAVAEAAVAEAAVAAVTKAVLEVEMVLLGRVVWEAATLGRPEFLERPDSLGLVESLERMIP
jgi:hypothetical protein